MPLRALLTPPLLAGFLVFGWAWLAPLFAARLGAPMTYRSIRWALAGGVGVLGVVAGWPALGPGLVNAPLPAFGIALGLLGAALTMYRIGRVAPSAAQSDHPAIETLWAAWLMTVLLACFPVLPLQAAVYATKITDGAQATPREAALHRWFDPWDDQALLALAWNAQREEELERAEDLRHLAERAGLSEAPAQELLAEIRATSGDCEGARAAFERALAARAEAALETLDLRLDDAYRLPETFVRNCELSEPELQEGPSGDGAQ